MQRWSISLLLVAPLWAQEPEEPAYVIRGRVETVNGKAVPATIHIWDALAADRPLARGETDESGIFELAVTKQVAARREHPYGQMRVVAHSPGFARAQHFVAAGGPEVSFALVKPAKWAGTVRSRAGEPLPGAPVVAWQGMMRFVTTTDERGRFVFRDIGPDATRVSADATGFRAATISKGKLEFALEPLPIVKGRVIDAATEAPLAGVQLVALDGDVEAESDLEGGFALEMEGGKGPLAAYLDGYAIARFDFDGGTIALRGADGVRGVVVDEKNEPVAFTSARLDPGFGAPRLARTNEAGAFEFPIGVSGFAFVHVDRRGYLPARATVDANWRTDRVRVSLRKGRAVEILVMANKPVMGAEVSFYRRLRPFGLELAARAYTGPDGVVRLASLPPDAVLVTAIGGALHSGEQELQSKLLLRVVDKPSVRGTVLDDAGVPVEGLTIHVEPKHVPAVKTDAKGRYEIKGLGPRPYSLVVDQTDEFMVLRRPVRGPGALIDFTVDRNRGPYRLGIALSPARAHATRVELRGRDWRRVRWVPPAVRLAVFEGLPSGNCSAVASAPGFQETTLELVLAADVQSSQRELVLARAGTVRVKATAGATVVIQTLHGEPAPAVSLALAEGSGELAGFGPGRYRFLSRAPGEIIVVEEIEVGEKDPPRDLDLTGGPASTLKVTVTDSASNPVRGVSIDLLTEGGLRFPTGVMTDDKGIATLARLIRGRLVIVAQKGDLRSEKAIAIGSGAAHEATLVLE